MKKIIVFLQAACIGLLVSSLSFGAGTEVRKFGEYDLSWGPYGTTWTSSSGKSVRYIPRYFDNNAFTDNLTLYGKGVTGDNTGRLQDMSIGSASYTDNGYLADLITKGPWVDVRAYLPTGFVSDGSVNYTTQVQAAMNSGKAHIKFPPGVWQFDNVTVPITVLRISGEASSPRGSTTPSQLLTNAGGNILNFSAGADTVEIDHLYFKGSGATAITGTGYLVKTNIHHNEFDRNLADCINADLILSIIEHNVFGYSGTAGASHRHINSVGDSSSAATNANHVRYNRFYGAKGTYSTVFDGGQRVTFVGNNWETNSVIPVALNGMEKTIFRDNWFEANQGLYEVTTSDATTGTAINRSLVFDGNTFGPHDNVTHLINLGDTIIPKVFFRNNDSSANCSGKYITKSVSGNDADISEYVNNRLLNYSRENYNVTKNLKDGFSARKSSANANFTGDGTSYTVLQDTQDVDNIGTFDPATGIHVAATAGLYSYSIGVDISGIDNAHTAGLISLVTTSRTYITRIHPYNVADVDGRVQLTMSVNAYMTANDNAYVTVAVYNGTKVVDMTSSGNWFSGARID